MTGQEFVLLPAAAHGGSPVALPPAADSAQTSSPVFPAGGGGPSSATKSGGLAEIRATVLTSGGE